MSILNVGNNGDGRKLQQVYVLPKNSDGAQPPSLSQSPARQQQVLDRNSGNHEHLGLRRLKGNEPGARLGMQPLRQQEPQQSQTTRGHHQSGTIDYAAGTNPKGYRGIARTKTSVAVPVNPTRIELSQFQSALQKNKEPVPRSFKDRPEQRQFNLISTIAKNKKIQFDALGPLEKRSKSTLQNYKTIHVERTAERTMGDSSDYNNTSRNLPPLQHSAIKSGMARRSSQPDGLREPKSENFYSFSRDDIPSKEIRSSDLGIYNKHGGNGNFTPVNPLHYHGEGERLGGGNLGHDPNVSSLVESQMSRFSKNSTNQPQPGLSENTERGLHITLRSGIRLPVFGNALARMPQKKDINLQQMRTILPSLNKDQVRLLQNEYRLIKLKEKQLKEVRQRELLEWAKADYGIDMSGCQSSSRSASSTKYGRFYNSNTKSNRLIIEDEADFIHKVRNRYFKKRNNETATRLQAFFRGCLVRSWYKKMRAHTVTCIVRIQSFMRMKWARRAYLRRLAVLYHNAALLLQRFSKGYLAAKVWKGVLHRKVIDGITAHFRELKIKLHTNSQIKIRFAWKLHKRRKKIKAEKRKAALAAKAKKKGKYGGSSRPAAQRAPAAAPSTAASTSSAKKEEPAGGKDAKKGDPKAATTAPKDNVKQTEEGLVDLQIPTVQGSELGGDSELDRSMGNATFGVEGVGNINILEMTNPNKTPEQSENKINPESENGLEMTAREPTLNQIKEEPNQEDDGNEGSQHGSAGELNKDIKVEGDKEGDGAEEDQNDGEGGDGAEQEQQEEQQDQPEEGE